MAILPLLAFLLVTHSAQALETRACETRVDRPGVRVQRCAGVSVVRLSGTPLERASAFGGLVREGHLSGEVLRYFTHKVTDTIDAEAGLLAAPLRLAYQQLVRLFHRRAPVPLAEEVDVMSAALGEDPIVLRRGLSLPDTGVLVQGLGSHPWLRALPTMGCTSVATKTAQGAFTYGRNLDFAGVGVWDKHPMLLAIEPAPGSAELRHLVIGADGLLFGGITGVNERGITFAVHQNYSTDIGVNGVPMVLIGELVLRGARTLDEAVAILRAHRPAILWTFVLTDLRSGEARAVESSSRHFLERRMSGPSFAQTNHALHPETERLDRKSVV